MVNMKNEEVKKIIGKAIELCTGHHMQGVKKHLLGAIREASAAEEKMARKKSPGVEIHKRWILDMASGSMRNMSKVEADRALGNIERMIADEEKKNSESKPEEDIFMD